MTAAARGGRSAITLEEGPPMQKISLLLADVDGTLVTEQKVLTDRARAAVAALHERGIRFAITSGRPPRGMAMLIEPLALRSPLAGFNGGVFTHPDLSVIETRTLAPDVTRQAIEIILGHGMDAWLYTGTDWQIHKKDAPHVAREAWTVKFEPTVVARYSDADLDQAVKIVGVSDDHDLVAKCEADVAAALGEHASAKRSQPYYLDITHPAANKGAVVDELVKKLGIPAAEVATIGDMPNDVLMFRRSGFSIAMGNASDEVKAQASAVTDSYNDEGFAKAVERYLLSGRTA
jgi:Cof subfamily protein (haloacid dehalogenase superfamily)